MRVRIVRMRTLSACVEWVHRAGDYRQLLSSRPVLGIDQGGGLAATLPSRPCAARANGVISRDLPPGNMTRVDTAHIMACSPRMPAFARAHLRRDFGCHGVSIPWCCGATRGGGSRQGGHIWRLSPRASKMTQEVCHVSSEKAAYIREHGACGQPVREARHDA